eukprot:TRINITY_DN3304_c0_g2_i3.p1 TRINITY_DN3304_c0_g2~~TRINITY_DN3304_c0_g2_i3.p1  ORF type:complete len:708 (-),score=85.92 TRINITY_DN3304_c0_g2_i3:381-2504(-)
MSILRTLEASGRPSNEPVLYSARNNRVAAPVLGMNPSNLMKLQFRGEANNGLTINSQAQMCMFPPEAYYSMGVLSKRSLSEMERQLMLRSVRQRTNNGPILSSGSCSPSLSESVVLSGSSSSASLPGSPSSCVYSPRQHQLSMNVNRLYSQGSVHTPPTRIGSSPMSDSSIERLIGLPVLQSASGLEKPSSFAQSFSKPPAFNPPSSNVMKMTSPVSEGSAISPDEGMRHRLQELERELLSDDDDPVLADAFSPEPNSTLDREWADTIQNLLSEEPLTQQTAVSCASQEPPWDLQNAAFKENLSSEASRSQPANQTLSLSSQQDQKSSVTQGLSDSGISSRELLLECATAIAESKSETALNILTRLVQMISVYGDPMQRLTAYMVEALVQRLGPSAQGLQNSLKCKETPTKDSLSISKLLFEVCPYIKYGCLAANNIILEAVKEEAKVHVVHFELGQGTQYIDLLNQFAARTGGPPELRITVVEDPDTQSHSASLIRDQLMKHAESLGVSLKFNIVTERAAEMQPSRLDCRAGEALAVNFAFHLHHMPDESVSTENPRDQLLRLVKGLNPKVVTVVEKEMNINTAPFLARFKETLSFYSAAFESLDNCLPRDNRDRSNVERHSLARDIINIIACEGAERTKRCEVAGKWRARMSMAGFSALSFSTNIETGIRPQLEAFGNNYRLRDEKGALHFGWVDRVLVVVSAWH